MTHRPLRVAYMGTPDFAVPPLEALVDQGHDVVGVVTNPDRPAGRGKSMRPSAVKRCAVDHGLDVFQPTRLKNNAEALAAIRAWEPDVAVVAAYGQILPTELLDVPTHGCINIHASLLPKYRGAAPINWAIIDGRDESGITIMQMEAGLDTGPILMQEATPIGALETAGELHDRLSTMGARLIVEALGRLAEGTLEATPQDDDAASYARMLSKDDGRIDWTQSARDVVNLIRGVNPWPGGFARFGGKRIKLHRARRVDGTGEPGEVLSADRRLIVACGSGAVEVIELQAPGSRAMPALDFLNGFEIVAGDVFD